MSTKNKTVALTEKEESAIQALAKKSDMSPHKYMQEICRLAIAKKTVFQSKYVVVDDNK